MDAAKDRLLRRVTIGVTSTVALLMITADYGTQPHALSAVTRWWDAGKDWFLKPSEKELAELEKLRKNYDSRESPGEEQKDRK
ncbi:hypothetical protein R1sor_023574 [Riccia sorocarpa]|uniref:Uncharacterized protein n=1 Tax=Riccia sorocarpa TaxID=122646 RepID=A0ABD3GNT7_9MARC